MKTNVDLKETKEQLLLQIEGTAVMRAQRASDDKRNERSSNALMNLHIYVNTLPVEHPLFVHFANMNESEADEFNYRLTRYGFHWDEEDPAKFVSEEIMKEWRKKLTSKKRCPEGFKFGKDTDKYKACNTCDEWNDCIATKQQRTKTYSLKEITENALKKQPGFVHTINLNERIAMLNISIFMDELFAPLGLTPDEKAEICPSIALHFMKYCKGYVDGLNCEVFTALKKICAKALKDNITKRI